MILKIKYFNHIWILLFNFWIDLFQPITNIY